MFESRDTELFCEDQLLQTSILGRSWCRRWDRWCICYIVGRRSKLLKWLLSCQVLTRRVPWVQSCSICQLSCHVSIQSQGWDRGIVERRGQRRRNTWLRSLTACSWSRSSHVSDRPYSRFVSSDWRRRDSLVMMMIWRRRKEVMTKGMVMRIQQWVLRMMMMELMKMELRWRRSAWLSREKKTIVMVIVSKLRSRVWVREGSEIRGRRSWSS